MSTPTDMKRAEFYRSESCIPTTNRRCYNLALNAYRENDGQLEFCSLVKYLVREGPEVAVLSKAFAEEDHTLQ